MACYLFGLNVRSVRSGDKPAERKRKIEEFNQDITVDVLVASILVLGMGVNLHLRCSNGVIIQYPCSFDKLNQAEGRLERMGQAKAVIWTVVVAAQSFYGYQEHVLVRKYAKKLAT